MAKTDIPDKTRRALEFVEELYRAERISSVERDFLIGALNSPDAGNGARIVHLASEKV